jgi:transcriptional regulator with XRE-family HTH domain
MSPAPKGLADRIRQEINRRGWSMYRLAKEAGVAESTASRFMRGENDPDLTTLEKYLRAIDWVVGPRTRSKP